MSAPAPAPPTPSCTHPISPAPAPPTPTCTPPISPAPVSTLSPTSASYEVYLCICRHEEIKYFKVAMIKVLQIIMKFKKKNENYHHLCIHLFYFL